MKVEDIEVSFKLSNGTIVKGYVAGEHGEWQQWGGTIKELSQTQVYIEAINNAVIQLGYDH